MLTGDMEQRDRENQLVSFLKGESKIMIASDVAARGLDLPRVTHVLNYDFPQ